MNMKRILSLVLALSLMLLTPAALASGPRLEVSASGQGAQMSMNGLTADCYGIQATLTLDRLPQGLNVQFSGAVTGLGTHQTYQVNGSQVTIYVVSKIPMNQGASLDIGVLGANEAFTVTSVSDLKLLDEQSALDEFDQTQTPNVPIDPTNPSQPPVTPSQPPVTPEEPSNPTNPGSSGPATQPRPEAPAPTPPASTSAPETPEIPENTPPTEPVSRLPFTDVPVGSWYYDAVLYAYEKGLMNGISETSFAPDGTTTRAQIVTILHRLEGSPKAIQANFSDVPKQQWFSDSISWAASEGIVNGYGNGAFGPNDNITREQMAAILYRYAQYKGINVQNGRLDDLLGFEDVLDVSAYALDAMKWVCSAGIINGTSATTLSPQSQSTRAQAATILMRFCQSFLDAEG